MSTSYEHLARRFQHQAPPFTVSRIRPMHPLWRYLWPYRSANHFTLTMCSAIAIWAVQGLFLSQHVPNYFNPVSLLMLLIFVPVMIPYDELPAKVTITTHVPAHRFLNDIGEEMVENRYVLQASASGEPGHVHFCPREKAEFWPMLWTKQDMDVWLRNDNKIDIYGSKVDLSKLVHCLKRRYKRSRRAVA